MTLKLASVSKDIERMVTAHRLKESASYLQEARALLRATDPLALAEKIRSRSRKFPWLVAVPLNTLAGTFTNPGTPSSFSVIGADGSSIQRDRHSPIRFYVINKGHAILTYGPHPGAELDSSARLYFEDRDLFINPEQKAGAIDEDLAMSVAEMAHLLECTASVGRPAVALRDGSLILWALQEKGRSVQEQDFYLKRFLGCLTGLRASKIPVASYISYSGGYDVCNALRFEICHESPVTCRTCSLGNEERKKLCQWLGQTYDRELFSNLGPGDRTDIFGSTSDILRRYGEEHTIDFFYLNVRGEIARVEIPRWVSADAEMLDLVHAVVYDQCQRSSDVPAYPPALQEAHEQAVISVGDRRLVEEIIERTLAQQGITYTRSAKHRSKRRRGV